MWPTTANVADASSPCGQTQESIMAILPNINRRQLLTSAATIAVAGIAPDIAHAEALAKSDIAQPTKALLPPSTQAQARNFGTVTVRRLREIAERNRIRQEAGLPLLSVAKQLRRMKEATDTEKFRMFADAHRKRVYDKMLARVRRRCGDPNWAPTGMLSGGGLRFGAQVDEQMRKLYRRIAVPGQCL
jgi:hypothetical protein